MCRMSAMWGLSAGRDGSQKYPCGCSQLDDYVRLQVPIQMGQINIYQVQ